MIELGKAALLILSLVPVLSLVGTAPLEANPHGVPSGASPQPTLLAPFGTVDEKFFDLHFDANVRGLFFSVQEPLPLMKDGGSIILNGSIADIKGFPAMSVYSATKAAVRSFARTWTNDLRDRRIE